MRGTVYKTPERVAEARQMRDDGMKLREIAEHFGLHLKTVHAWITDPDGAAARRRRAGYRGVCVDCGAPTDGSDGPGKARERCGPCARKLGRGGAVLVERAAPRREAMARRWREGASMNEMAAEFGIARGTVSFHLNKLRALGYDVPHRYAMKNGRRVAAETTAPQDKEATDG